MAIYTDSKVTLDLLRNIYKHEALMDKIKRKLRPTLKSRFHWVKARVELEEDESTERLTKQERTHKKLKCFQRCFKKINFRNLYTKAILE